jgi:hypothetical protein
MGLVWSSAVSTQCRPGADDRYPLHVLPFRILSHLLLPMGAGSGATRCRVAVTVLPGRDERPVPSSQFTEEHLGG